MLAEAGYPGGEGLAPVRAALPGYLRLLESELVESLAGLGVQVEIDWIEKGTSLSTLDCDFTLSTWIADYPDPDGFFRGLMGARRQGVLER